MVVLVVSLVAIGGCGGDDSDSGRLVDYSFTGIRNSHTELHVTRGGTVEVESDYKPGCPAAPATVKLDDPALDRLRKALESARLDEQKSLVRPGAQQLEIRSGEVTYRHVTDEPLPTPVQLLVSELSRVTSFACDANRSDTP
jgi:hypothetical protein